MSNPDAPLYLGEAADYLGVSQKTVRRMIADGSLPAYRLGGTGRLRFLRKDLDALLIPITAVTHEQGAVSE